MKKLYTKRIILLLIFAGVLGFFLGFVSNGTTEIKLPYYEEWDEYDCVYGEITDFQHKSESDRVEEVTTIYCPIEGNKVFQYPLLESCFQYVTIYGATYIDDDKVQVTQLSYPKLIINLNFLSDKKMMDMYSECRSPYFMMGPNTQSISEELWENADANQEFDFTYKAPTLTGYSNNNLTDGNSLTATSDVSEATFNLAAATNAGYKIENVVMGTDKYVYIKEMPNDAYELTSVTAKSGDSNIEVAKEGDYYKVPVNTPNVEITVTNTIKSADLTIVKAVTNSNELALDPDQTFLFRVKGKETDNGTKDVDMYVTINGTGSLTIKNLPVGAYTVQEMTNWSWRYDVTAIAAEKDTTVTTDNTTGTIGFDLTYQGEKVSFTNDRTDPYLLDGNAYASNVFAGKYE